MSRESKREEVEVIIEKDEEKKVKKEKPPKRRKGKLIGKRMQRKVRKNFERFRRKIEKGKRTQLIGKFMFGERREGGSFTTESLQNVGVKPDPTLFSGESVQYEGNFHIPKPRGKRGLSEVHKTIGAVININDMSEVKGGVNEALDIGIYGVKWSRSQEAAVSSEKSSFFTSKHTTVAVVDKTDVGVKPKKEPTFSKSGDKEILVQINAPSENILGPDKTEIQKNATLESRTNKSILENFNKEYSAEKFLVEQKLDIDPKMDPKIAADEVRKEIQDSRLSEFKDNFKIAEDATVEVKNMKGEEVFGWKKDRNVSGRTYSMMKFAFNYSKGLAVVGLQAIAFKVAFDIIYHVFLQRVISSTFSYLMSNPGLIRKFASTLGVPVGSEQIGQDLTKIEIKPGTFFTDVFQKIEDLYDEDLWNLLGPLKGYISEIKKIEDSEATPRGFNSEYKGLVLNNFPMVIYWVNQRVDDFTKKFEVGKLSKDYPQLLDDLTEKMETLNKNFDELVNYLFTQYMSYEAAKMDVSIEQGSQDDTNYEDLKKNLLTEFEKLVTKSILYNSNFIITPFKEAIEGKVKKLDSKTYDITFGKNRGVAGENQARMLFVALNTFSSSLFEIIDFIWNGNKIESYKTVRTDILVKKEGSKPVKPIGMKEDTFKEIPKSEIISNISKFERGFILIEEIKEILSIENVKTYIIDDDFKDSVRISKESYKNVHKMWMILSHYIQTSKFVSKEFGKDEDLRYYNKGIMKSLFFTDILLKSITIVKEEEEEEEKDTISDFFDRIADDMKKLEGLAQIMDRIRTSTKLEDVSISQVFPITFFYNALIYGIFSEIQTPFVRRLMMMYRFTTVFPKMKENKLYKEIEDLIFDCATLYGGDNEEDVSNFIDETRYMCYHAISERNIVFLIGFIWFLLVKSSLKEEVTEYAQRPDELEALIKTAKGENEGDEFYESFDDLLIKSYKVGGAESNPFKRIIKLEAFERLELNDKKRFFDISTEKGGMVWDKEKKVRQAKKFVKKAEENESDLKDYFENMQIDYDSEEGEEQIYSDLYGNKILPYFKSIHSALVGFVKTLIFNNEFDVQIFTKYNNPFMRLILHIYFKSIVAK